MPSNQINCIAEDADGFMWIGTDKGLSKSDGSYFENFLHSDDDPNSLSNDYILDVLPDKKNAKIWVAHRSGLSAFDLRKNYFQNYFHNSEDPQSIPDHRAYSLFKDQENTIWIGFQGGGLLRYRPDTDNFDRFLCYNAETNSQEYNCDYGVVQIAEDPNNTNVLWLATHYGLLQFYKNNGEFEQYIYQHKIETKFNRLNSVMSLFVHPNGNIYYDTFREGIAVFDRKSKSFSLLNPCNGTIDKSRGFHNSHGFQPISEEQFWINTNYGIELFDIPSGCIVQSYTNDKEFWYGMDYIDDKGRIWAASDDRGLIIYNSLYLQSRKLSFEAPTFEYPCRTKRIIEDPALKRLYVLADASSGLYIYNQITEEWICIPPPVGYDLKAVNGFHAKDMGLIDGNIFIVGDHTFYWYEPGFERLQKHPIQLPSKNPRTRNLIHTTSGEYWVSSSIHGLYKLNFESGTLENKESELAEIGYRLGGDYMAEDVNGNLWYREHNGLIIFDRSNNKFIYHPHDAQKKNALRGMGAIEADAKGNVWIAGRGDYFGYAHADSIQQGVLKFYGKKDGLIGDHVYLVKPYKEKMLVFTDVGMQIFDPKHTRFEQYYTMKYGFGKNISTATILADGSLAVGNQKAINIFKPESLQTNTEIPVPYVSSFSVFDESWKLNNSPSHIDTVQLSYKQNFFSFEFSSIAFNLPDKTNFQYKLEGFDENWQNGTKRKFAAYTNVPGGDYQFIVKAVNNEGLALSAPSITHLRISTVWYKATWFWVMSFVLLFTLGYAIYKWRISQVRKEERLKADYERKLADVEMSALRAQMNPHFIFNSLNSIEYYIINNDPEKASDYLNRFSRLIRLILQNSKNTIVSLKDDLEALKLYIEMESMRFDDLFDYEVKIETGIDLEKISVPPMLLQPYVENAIWHGLMQKEEGRGKLELKLQKRNGHLLCFVEDNGIGREAASRLKSKSATRRKSYGMKITSDRLAMLNNLAGSNASVQVIDLKEEGGNAAGTRVELVIPL